mgnify:CR=1 FL=1
MTQQKIGRYEIKSELGRGGMATVYFGRALAVAGFQRLVAIKSLHPHLLKDAQFVQMFLDEGRLAGAGAPPADLRAHDGERVGMAWLALAAGALWVGSTRLIDNLLCTTPSP